MSQIVFDAPELKQLLKQVLTETLIEQRALLREVFIDALEEVALAEAIRQGQTTTLIDRSQFPLPAGEG
ncbi:hypothetical protein HUU62_01965 [Rhodoferax sp. 4810]|uniref:Uncharacterized protein n=1 Tax=Thiospirillum jenense TaxID=1653858 RepID=A0A839HC92_9GAMM|nr:hypothetical protein [Thiospirillum jenense]MBB1073180.1 hypothetical protein [Rhodoferax jenense]MBB1124659.1 hypothetical protein [Thiospirillum jenense]